MKLPRLNWFLLIRLAGIVLFIIILLRTDLRELWGWLRNVEIRWVILAFSFQVLLLLFKCLRWLWMNETDFRKKQVFQRFGEFLEGYAMGVVTPGRLGELVKAGHAKGRTNVVSSSLLVISERGLDLSLFVLMAGLSIGWGFMANMNRTTGYFLILIALTGILIAFALLMFRKLVKSVEKLLKSLSLISKDQSLNYIQRSYKFLSTFGFLSILSNLSSFLSFYCIAIAVAINLSFMNISGGVALAGVINSIPVTIMGVGTRDVTLLLVLKEIPKAQIIAFSGLILLISQVGGGIIALTAGQYFLYRAKKMKQ